MGKLQKKSIKKKQRKIRNILAEIKQLKLKVEYLEHELNENAAHIDTDLKYTDDFSNDNELLTNHHHLININHNNSTNFCANVIPHEKISPIKLFSPKVTHTIMGPSKIGYNYGANIFNESDNIMISCPSDKSLSLMQFDHITTPKSIFNDKLLSSVVYIAYNQITEQYLLGCSAGQIYLFDCKNKSPKLIYTHKEEEFILAISFINESDYIFSCAKSGSLFARSIYHNQTIDVYSQYTDCWFLYKEKKRNIIYAGLANGQICIYRTDKYNNIKLINTTQAHQKGRYVTCITEINIKNKHYIVTCGNDYQIIIWQTLNSQIKALKTIKTNYHVSTMVYLPKFQILAISCHQNNVIFYQMPQGIKITDIELGSDKIRNIFPLFKYNCLGVADLKKDIIQIISFD